VGAPLVWESAIALAINHQFLWHSGARPVFLLANAALVLALSAIAYAVTNRWLLAQVLTLTVGTILVLADIGKLLVLNRPLYLRDFMLTRQVFSLAPVLVRSLAPLLLVLAVLLAGAALGLLWAVRRCCCRLRLWQRLAVGFGGGAVTGLFVCWNLFIPQQSRFGEVLNHGNWDERTYFSEKGLLLALALRYSSGFVMAPNGYSEALIRRIVANAGLPNAEPPAASGVEPPNIIVYLGEAFWDPTQLHLRFNRDPMPNLRKLLQGPVAGELMVPTYGGMTPQTEFEILTGLSTLYLPPGVIAYSRYVNRPLPALPAVLKALGYRTSAVHTYHAWFWDRSRIYPFLGIDSFHAIGEFVGAPTVGPFISDEALVDRVIQVSEETSPSFVMAISLVTHGPYDYEEDVGHAIEVRGAISDASCALVSKYSNALLHADEAIGTLISHFQASKRRTLIVIFGDHLPMLGPNFETYSEAGFYQRNGNGDDQNRMFKTPVVVWANYDLPKEKLDCRANFLAPRILKAAGVPGGLLFDYVGKLGQSDPLLVEDDDSRPIQDYQAIEYDLIFGKQYLMELDPILRKISADSNWGRLSPAERLQRLQATFPPPEVVDFGPKRVRPGEAFGRQSSGASALWVQCLHASGQAVVRLDDVDLVTTHAPDGLLSAEVATALIAKEGRHPLRVFDPVSHKQSASVFFEVSSRPEESPTPLPQPTPTLPPPPAITDWGPHEVQVGKPFNRQPDGSSALWFETRNATTTTVAVLDGTPLATVYESPTSLSANVGRHWRAEPGTHSIYLLDRNNAQRSGEVTLVVLDRGALTPTRVSTPPSVPTSSPQPTPTRLPAAVLDWGPREVVAGVCFNCQPDGSSSFWFQMANATPTTTVLLDGRPLRTYFKDAGSISAALPSNALPARVGRHTIVIQESATRATIAALPLTITASPASPVPR
jgi:phosphoglycerol transferase MdoB-like AlkP superfamily enzyme